MLLRLERHDNPLPPDYRNPETNHQISFFSIYIF